ncbi:ABC transporter ATP-binding protein [Bosea sp. (in: a-proteobacteria)]|uniref:ABC transporter ATP-binding protein n=1 Tax=Bosea sp. (in: a-proteobacteria) TaxID=1871050 RepID=UPI002607DDFD|nr:ABC transporter ATP-binding protein [Bosea sp. (in: a-proteobacteria)]MCO5090885.1 ABC transporter ATP-binding protein [Bosea sp. (in: a-proteobacteria)]
MTVALRLTGVAKSFDQLSIIAGIDLAIPAGERHALIGPNGAGKSTLFNLISGRLPVSAGVVELFGIEIQNRAPHRVARLGLSRSFQITNLFARLTVLETLEAALLWPAGIRYSLFRRMNGISSVRDRARQLADELGLASVLHVASAELAYADQRALEIGVAAAGDAKVVLLDEPTAGMSRSETQRTVALIRRITEGRTLVMVEHDMGVVFDLADRISVLARGRILISAAPDVVRADPAVREAYLGAIEETARC